MSLEPEMLKSLVKVAAEQVIASAPELTALDQAVGDGDHGANMKRGFEAVLGKLDGLAEDATPGDVLKSVATTLIFASCATPASSSRAMRLCRRERAGTCGTGSAR